jgi:YidC/Oxa1 family membrane protein insertase
MGGFQAIIGSIGQIFGAILHPFIVIFSNILIGLYDIFLFLHIPYPLGFAIIALTIILRLVTYPLVSKQLRYSKKVQSLAPRVADLKRMHKGDQKRFLSEQQKLYKEHGISQTAGCLPTLIQLPFLYGIYMMLTHVVTGGAIQQIRYVNSLVIEPLKISRPLDTNFFGLSLGARPSELVHSMGLIILLVPLITGALTFIQSKMMAVAPVKGYKSDSPKEKNEKKEVSDMSTQMQGQMLLLVPLMIGYASFTFPLGISLYWNTSTIFAIIQQYKISGWGGMESIWRKIKK